MESKNYAKAEEQFYIKKINDVLNFLECLMDNSDFDEEEKVNFSLNLVMSLHETNLSNLKEFDCECQCALKAYKNNLMALSEDISIN